MYQQVWPLPVKANRNGHYSGPLPTARGCKNFSN